MAVSRRRSSSAALFGLDEPDDDEQGESGTSTTGENAAGRTLLINVQRRRVALAGVREDTVSVSVSSLRKSVNADFSSEVVAVGDDRMPSKLTKRLVGATLSFRMMRRRRPGAGRQGAVDGGSLSSSPATARR